MNRPRGFICRVGSGNQIGYPPQQSNGNFAPFWTPGSEQIRPQQNNMNQFGGSRQQQQPENSAEHSGGKVKAPWNWMPAITSVDDILKKKNHNEGPFDDETIEVLSGPEKYDFQNNLLENFEDAGFPPMLMTNIQRMNYKNPQAIQKFAIPAIRKGFDFVGQLFFNALKKQMILNKMFDKILISIFVTP